MSDAMKERLASLAGKLEKVATSVDEFAKEAVSIANDLPGGTRAKEKMLKVASFAAGLRKIVKDGGPGALRWIAKAAAAGDKPGKHAAPAPSAQEGMISAEQVGESFAVVEAAEAISTIQIEGEEGGPVPFPMVPSKDFLPN